MSKLLSYDFYGMAIVDLGNREYAIGTNDQANKAVHEYIEDFIWSFQPTFIASHAIIDDENIIKIIQLKCENSNEAILKLITDFDVFVSDAIGSDGRGQFLSGYDGRECELNELDDDDARDIARLLKIKKKNWSNYYVYRII